MSAIEFNKGLMKLNEGVWAYLQPDGSWGLSNAGLVAQNGESLLIDTLYDVDLTGEMLSALRSVAPEADSIDYLVNTHDNGDHWFGNMAAEAREIISSEACARAMAAFPPKIMADILKAAPTMGKLGEFLIRCFSRYNFEGLEPVLPTRTFTRELSLKVGGLEVNLIEVGPCHTGGDVIVHIPAARAVFAADVLFIGGHPIMWAGPVGNMIKAIDKIINLDPEYIVPGHGPVTDVQGAAALKQYWEYYSNEAKKRFDRGMTSQEAARDIPLGEYSSYLDPERIILNVNVLYKEFSGDPAPVNPVEQLGFMAEWQKD